MIAKIPGPLMSHSRLGNIDGEISIVSWYNHCNLELDRPRKPIVTGAWERAWVAFFAASVKQCLSIVVNNKR
jgi:hypothetical protein